MLAKPDHLSKQDDFVWVDCFFYGFYLKKDEAKLWKCRKPIATNSIRITKNTKNVQLPHSESITHHLDMYIDQEENDYIPVQDILDIIDSKEPSESNINGRCSSIPSLDYAISIGTESVRYVVDTFHSVSEAYESPNFLLL